MKSGISKGMNIGALTLLVVFTILCLTIFGVLSFASAEADYRQTKRNTRQVEQYYAADGKAEEFLKEVDVLLKDAVREGLSGAELRARVEEGLGSRFDAMSGQAVFTAPVGEAVQLEVKLSFDFGENPSYRVTEWKTVGLQDVATDNTLDLWDGN